jgi:hypothetical protein
MDIDALVESSKDPLPDAWLEGLQAKIHGTPHRHPRFLYRLALELKPAVAMEMGVEWGVTSAHLCAAAAQYGGQVIGVDIQTHPRPAEELNAKYCNYTFLHMDTQRAVSYVTELVEEHGPLGLVYQDSAHVYKEFKREWSDYSPLLGDGAAWVANLYPGDTLLRYWKWLPVKEKYLYRDSLYPGASVGVAVLGW